MEAGLCLYCITFPPTNTQEAFGSGGKHICLDQLHSSCVHDTFSMVGRSGHPAGGLSICTHVATLSEHAAFGINRNLFEEDIWTAACVAADLYILLTGFF